MTAAPITPRSGSWVAGNHRLEALPIDVRVDLRGGDVRMSEHGLHRAQVGAALEQVGGEAVPQRVRVHAAQPRRARVAAEQLPESLARHAAAAGSDEEIAAAPFAEQLLPRAGEISAQRFPR